MIEMLSEFINGGSGRFFRFSASRFDKEFLDGYSAVKREFNKCQLFSQDGGFEVRLEERERILGPKWAVQGRQ